MARRGPPGHVGAGRGGLCKRAVTHFPAGRRRRKKEGGTGAHPRSLSHSPFPLPGCTWTGLAVRCFTLSCVTPRCIALLFDAAGSPSGGGSVCPRPLEATGSARGQRLPARGGQKPPSPPAPRRGLRCGAGGGTCHAPTGVFLESGGVGKTNKALESVDVTCVS